MMLHLLVDGGYYFSTVPLSPASASLLPSSVLIYPPADFRKPCLEMYLIINFDTLLASPSPLMQ
jgi:hypothetical protein